MEHIFNTEIFNDSSLPFFFLLQVMYVMLHLPKNLCLWFILLQFTFKSMICKLINLRILFSYGSRYGSKFLFPASFAEKTSFPPLNCPHAYIGYYLSTCVLSIYPSVFICLDLFLPSLICFIDLLVYMYKNVTMSSLLYKST